MINIFLLTISHALGSFENANEKISEMMYVSTETNVTIKNTYHEITQWKRHEKHLFILSSFT